MDINNLSDTTRFSFHKLNKDKHQNTCLSLFNPPFPKSTLNEKIKRNYVYYPFLSKNTLNEYFDEEDKQQTTFLIKNKEGYIGIIRFININNRFYIYPFLDFKCRGKGAGTEILTSVIKDIISKSDYPACIFTKVDIIEDYLFFEKIGFKMVENYECEELMAKLLINFE